MMAWRAGRAIGAAILIGLVGIGGTASCRPAAVEMSADATAAEETPRRFGPSPGSPAWVQESGLAAASEAEVARDVPFPVRMPSVLGQMKRTGLYVCRERKILVGDGKGRSAKEAAVASYGVPVPPSERRAVAFYGTIMVTATRPEGLGTAAEYVRAGIEHPDLVGVPEATATVNGIPACGWSRGTYATPDGPSSSTDSQIGWVQDGMNIRISSNDFDFEDLVPLAEELAKRGPLR